MKILLFFFSMTRDQPAEVLDRLLSPSAENEKLRQTTFPDLDYAGLYNALQSVADDIQLINTGAIGKIGV